MYYDGDSMNKVCIIMFLSMMLFASSALAFPLHGSNGVVSATIYGATKEGANAYVDLSVSMPVTGNNPTNVDLIDNDDKLYKANGLINGGSDPLNNYSARSTMSFSVPEDIIIKRVRVTPATSDPFSIDWTGVPEASDNDTTMKFYGATKPSDINPAWSFDVKITNNAPGTMTYTSQDFKMIDQFGWKYGGSISDSGKILSNESLRFKFETIASKFSRPIALEFKDLALDISAWA